MPIYLFEHRAPYSITVGYDEDMSIRKRIDTFLKNLETEYVTHNRIEVSRSAILHNLELFEKLSGMPAIPVLKGNAYGHDITLVAKVLKNCHLPYIAVDSYFEALRIREVSNQPVLVMGSILSENYKNMKYNNFAFVVHDEASIHALGKTGKRINVHLEANTGMNRYGAKADEIVALTQLIRSYHNLTLEGFMSHLADSDGNDPTTVDVAVKQFDECFEAVKAAGTNPTLIHIAQSAGILKAKSKYANTFRLGDGLYGINPFPQNHTLSAQLESMQPALRLISTITKIIELSQDDRVSYNYTFTAPKKMKIGVLPIGFYEGLKWELSNRGVVKIGKQLMPIVGKVCMHHATISLDGLTAAVGDEVIVYSDIPGDKNTIDNIAHDHGFLNDDLLTSLSRDVRRVLVK